jgi:hypothetical protein
MPLPDAILEAWPSDSLEKIGALMEMAGIDPVEAFRVKAIRDHPWVGLEVQFPFPEVGKGKITHCLTHPRGKLMFDVTFPEPVPAVHNGRVVRNQNLYCDIHRFFGHELKAMAEVIVPRTIKQVEGEMQT